MVVKTAIIGYGVTAQVMHAPFLVTNKNYEVVTVLERHREDSKKLFPHAQVVRTIDELLQQDIELVIITTPNEQHFPQSVACLNAGKHVVLEKPFTVTGDEATQLVDLAKEKGLHLSPYHNRRYVADFRTLQRLLTQKLLGDVHTYEAHFHRYRPQAKPNAWREKDVPGAGVLYDLGPHLFDQVLCLFGLPQAITAQVDMQRSHAVVPDWFDVTFHYSKLNARLTAGVLVRQPGPRIQVHGTAGSFLKWGEDIQEAQLKAGALPNTSDWGKEPTEAWGKLYLDKDGLAEEQVVPSLSGNFGLYYDDLVQTLRNNAPLQVKPEHGYNTIKLIELAMQSSTERRTIDCTGLMNVPYPTATKA